jgi:hypothetical protein
MVIYRGYIFINVAWFDSDIFCCLWIGSSSISRALFLCQLSLFQFRVSLIITGSWGLSSSSSANAFKASEDLLIDWIWRTCVPYRVGIVLIKEIIPVPLFFIASCKYASCLSEEEKAETILLANPLKNLPVLVTIWFWNKSLPGKRRSLKISWILWELQGTERTWAASSFIWRRDQTFLCVLQVSEEKDVYRWSWFCVISLALLIIFATV